MTNFEKTVLTDAGLKLLGKEGIPTEFVRVETGCGAYVKDEDVVAQTKLKSKVQEMGVSSVSVISENKIRLKFAVSNKELDATYYFTEIGLYVNDPDEGEILYAICYATEDNAEKIQKYNGIFESTIAISLGIEVDNAGNVSFETKGAYALEEDLLAHEKNANNPHGVTLEQLGAGEIDNTSDANKPVSNAQRQAIDDAYYNSNQYTDEKIAELINGAPTTMDTLKEIADAMAENEDVVEALDEAIGSKADAKEFDSHLEDESNPHGVTKEQIGLGNTDDTPDKYKNVLSATKLTTPRTINGVEFDGTEDIAISDRKYAIVGSDGSADDSWFKVASQTMNNYGNTTVTFMVTSTWSSYYNGIFHLHFRGDKTSISCKLARWLTRIGFPSDCIRIVVTDITWTLYVKKNTGAYGRIMFEVLSESGIASAKSGITLYNSTTAESTEPTATVTSSDGATVQYANQLSNPVNIGKASFNGDSDIALANIMGRSQTTSSGSSYVGKYTKIATIDVSSSAYDNCNGIIHCIDSGTHIVNGLLYFYVGVTSDISTSSIRLRWVYLSTLDLKDTIVAVKVSDGVFDLYFKQITTQFTLLSTLIDCDAPSKITMLSKQAYVDSVEPVATSSLGGYVAQATQANQLNSTQLVNKNIDELLTAGLEYWAGANNGCTGDIPSSTVAFNLKVFKNAGSYLFQRLINQSGIIFTRAYMGEAWTDWSEIATVDELSNYLPLSGGELSGNLTQKRTDAKTVVHILENANRATSVQISDSGLVGMYDHTNSKWLFKSGLHGDTYFLGNADIATKAEQDANGLDIAANYMLTKTFSEQLVKLSQKTKYITSEGVQKTFSVSVGSIIFLSLAKDSTQESFSLIIAHVASEGVLADMYKSADSNKGILSLSGTTLLVTFGYGGAITILE